MDNLCKTDLYVRMSDGNKLEKTNKFDGACMELKQLEYFVVAAEAGSLNRAAAALFTSQPNVSKVIANLEKELGVSILKRTAKGVCLTAAGMTVYDNAKNILANVNVMAEMVGQAVEYQIRVSCYPSNMMARLMSDFYMKNSQHPIHIEFRERSSEEIIDDVARYVSEIGVMHISKKQMTTLNHVLDQKKLDFYPLKEYELCLYVGKNHPFYSRESVDFSELTNLKYVQGSKDYFALEYNLEKITEGAIQVDKLNHVIHTNSDHMHLAMLLYTDVCSLGIDFTYADYEQHEINMLKINNCDKLMVLGYVLNRNYEVSSGGELFLNRLKTLINGS